MNFLQLTPKSVIFAAVAALGCFVAALLAEPLFLVKNPSIIIPKPPETPSPAFVFCFDDSGSMRGRKREDVKQAAKDFVNARNMDKEKIGIVVFDDTPRISLPLSRDKGQILFVINSYYAGGGTMFADALQDAMNLLERDPEIAQLNQTHKDRTESVNEKIDEVNQRIEAGYIKGKTIEKLLPQTVPKIVLFFTDGENFDQARALRKAVELRENGIKIYAISTMDGDKDYLALMTGDASQVLMVSDAQIKDAFKQVEQKINADLSVAVPDFLKDVSRRKTSNDSDSIEIFIGTSRTVQIVQATVWSMLLCLGMCLCILLVQNQMMRKPLFVPRQWRIVCLVAAVGGFLAGFCGDAAFQIMPVAFIGRLVGLAILGAILAFAMSFHIANLDRRRALFGGSLGGVLGAVGFAVSTQLAGQTSGRLLGAAILGACIGAMIGFIEQFYRHVWLMVLYDPRRFTQVNLGSHKVTVGSASTDTVFVNDAEPNAATFLAVGDKVQYTDARGTQSLVPGNRVKVGNVELVVCSKDVPFSPSRFYPMKMSKAMELRRRE
ncbi:MAG: VWA domain-containing protein [Planctomycetaceae bacterium]|nr:VWA domain-containing protein [Planctomycetaceae bacterium]